MSESLSRQSYADRIRAGAIEPWVGEGAAGARRSAQIVADELGTLTRSDPRRGELTRQREAWLDRAAVLEEVE